MSFLFEILKEIRWRGLWGTVQAAKMNRLGTMKYFVGEDEFHNRYFQKVNDVMLKDRWVEYASKDFTPDPYSLPPEWHAWLHHIIDEPPTRSTFQRPIYQGQIIANRTGTTDAYFPKNNPLSKNFKGLAKDKLEPWNGNVSTNNVVSRFARSFQNNNSKEERDVLDLK
ncbi:hypothetical protein GpartN1_g1647.t1 [Galdieria partita]|uniref:NADH dehydrogenase [ubiquinone] 1 alpha subcomplex subunit 12 n=1 Tax=Galdieria partita TaxID=83374 RepID=A0A9C7PU30_9RHOD|nr:hypothetical protein GpartN1_g1647.t1 [Galdieria partita]